MILLDIEKLLSLIVKNVNTSFKGRYMIFSRGGVVWVFGLNDEYLSGHRRTFFLTGL